MEERATLWAKVMDYPTGRHDNQKDAWRPGVMLEIGDLDEQPVVELPWVPLRMPLVARVVRAPSQPQPRMPPTPS
jgi:hypothetical protein